MWWLSFSLVSVICCITSCPLFEWPARAAYNIADRHTRRSLSPFGLFVELASFMSYRAAPRSLSLFSLFSLTETTLHSYSLFALAHSRRGRGWFRHGLYLSATSVRISSCCISKTYTKRTESRMTPCKFRGFWGLLIGSTSLLNTMLV